MRAIDLSLSMKLPPLGQGFGEGAAEFIDLLARLRAVPGFGVDYFAQWAQDAPKIDLWTNQSSYLAPFETHNTDRQADFSIWAHESSAELHDFNYHWNAGHAAFNMVTLEIRRVVSAESLHPDRFMRMIEVLTGWKRPQHLRFGPANYFMDHHPLDRMREGVGWMGWVPFAVRSADIPEATRVMPMNGGTFIQGYPDFWQAWPQNPDFSQTAIDRTQELDIRLNLLGLLPSFADLRRGNWGR